MIDQRALKTLQEKLFPDGRVVISTFQRRNRIGYNAAWALLHELWKQGWLEGLEVATSIYEPPPQP